MGDKDEVVTLQAFLQPLLQQSMTKEKDAVSMNILNSNANIAEK